MGFIKKIIIVCAIVLILLFGLLLIAKNIAKTPQTGENYTSLYNTCLNEKTTLESNKNTIINQWASSYNILNDSLVKCEEKRHELMDQLLEKAEEKVNSSYVTKLVRQVNYLETELENCYFFNQSDREEQLQDNLTYCLERIDELEEIFNG